MPFTPQGPPRYPFVGHLPAFLYDKLGFLTRCASQFGDVASLHLGEPTLLLSSPDDVRHVLVVNGDNYVKSPRLTSLTGKRLSGFGLLTSLGAEHLRQRRMMQPAFSRKTVDGFAHTIAAGIRRTLAGWNENDEVDIGRELMAVAQQNIVRIVLGADADDDMPALLAAIAARRRYMEHVFFSPLPGWVPTPVGAEYRAAMRHIDAVVFRAIQARRQDRANGDDLLSLLLRAQYEDGTGMSDQQVRDEVVTLFVSGSETNGEALTWTCYLLARHPAIEARLRDEVDRLEGRAPSAVDAMNLAYTNMVLAESMRLYPPTWIFIRMARTADTLPSGAPVPAGSKVYLCPYVMHRHPRYFPDPERFDPERFSDEARRTRPALSYFPFGAGARLCIGEHIARLESACVLASIVQHARLERTSDAEVAPEPRMTLRPKTPIRMRVRAPRPTPAPQRA